MSAPSFVSMSHAATKFRSRTAEDGFVGAGRDAARPRPAGAATQVARRGPLLLDDRSCLALLSGRARHGVQLDVVVGAVDHAQPAADAVRVDLNLQVRALAVDGIDGTARQAGRLVAGAARGDDQE